jgi:hypothetical protein
MCAVPLAACIHFRSWRFATFPLSLLQWGAGPMALMLWLVWATRYDDAFAFNVLDWMRVCICLTVLAPVGADSVQQIDTRI